MSVAHWRAIGRSIPLPPSAWTRIYFGWRPNLRDEADNHLVELAVAMSVWLRRRQCSAASGSVNKMIAKGPVSAT